MAGVAKVSVNGSVSQARIQAAAQAQLQAQFQKYAASGGTINYMPNPADMFRTTSSTGLSALRAEHQGINR